MYILVDDKNIITCLANSECNLHKDKILAGHTTVEVDNVEMYCGDEYDPIERKIISRPENYPKPSIEELAEIQIRAEMRRLAVANLKTKGTLPSDFVDPKAVEEIPILTEAP
jgi:hypothetical protein